jgi:hypothetical protein
VSDRLTASGLAATGVRPANLTFMRNKRSRSYEQINKMKAVLRKKEKALNERERVLGVREAFQKQPIVVIKNTRQPEEIL